MNQAVAIFLGMKRPERGITYVANQIAQNYTATGKSASLHNREPANPVVSHHIPSADWTTPVLTSHGANEIKSICSGVIRGPHSLMVGHYSAGGVVLIISPVRAASVCDSDQSSLRRSPRPRGRSARQC